MSAPRLVVVSTCLSASSPDRCRESVASQILPVEHVFLEASRQDPPRSHAENLFLAAQSLDPDDVVLQVDGDDWLAHPRVTEEVSRLYEDPDVWLTYGSLITATGYYANAPYGPDEDVRASEWRCSHLKTCRAGLLQQIRPEDLHYEGEWTGYAVDRATTLPAFEMAGWDRTRWVKDILYVYTQHAGDDERGRKSAEAAAYFHGKVPYRRIASYRRRDLATIYGQEFFSDYRGQQREDIRTVAEEVHRLFRPKSALDVGAGPGQLVGRLRELGADAWGLDGSPVAMEWADEAVRPFLWREDVTGGASAFRGPPGGYDLVTCTEVAEHVPGEYADALVSKVCDACAEGGSVVWTAAPPGQGGHDHVHEQPAAYWEEKFAARGLQVDRERTAALRLAWEGRLGPRMDWYPKNVRVFCRGPQTQTAIVDSFSYAIGGFESAESAPEPKVTLVTGFFRLSDRQVDEAEMAGLFGQLAECGLPIVLFCDHAPPVGFFGPPPKNVRLVPTTLDAFMAYRIALGRDWQLPEHRDEKKDTREFLLLQNSKTEMMLRALVHTKNSHIAWIDFGILKIVKDRPAFLRKLREVSAGPLPERCVLAPGCWPPMLNPTPPVDSVCWRFCGGLLLAARASVLDLHQVWLRTFASMPKLTWEVNVWAEMERRGQKFDWYEADHDNTILAIGGAEVMKKRAVRAVPPSPTETPRIDPALRQRVRTVARQVPRVCLTMIVKNEAKIILRCLASALPFVDSWLIADTGSTDGTPEIVEKFFARNQKPGAIVRTTFKNFAQARNFALDAARAVPGWDYALLLDADMVLSGTLDKGKLTAPAYEVTQRDGFMDYANKRLVRRDAEAKYFGVTHEYLSVEGAEHLPTLQIDDRGDGGSKGNKADRDIALLFEGLKAEPKNERYMFYLANTLREVGRCPEAIKWYRKRIDRGGWDEEVWASHYGIARCYASMGKHEENNLVKACLDAYGYRPSRGEPLKLLSKYYRDSGRNELACLFAEELSKVAYPGDKLFVERDVYSIGADEELAIAAYYSPLAQRREVGYRACARLTVHPTDWVREQARKNFTYYARSAADLFGAEVRPIEWAPTDGWHPCNPSVWVSGDRRLVLVRTVNYTVTREGQYPTIDNSGIIKTKNYVLEFDGEWEVQKSTAIVDITGTARSEFPVEGFEDCRLWSWMNGDFPMFYLSATVRDLADNPDGRCEMVTSRLNAHWQITDIIPIRNRSQTEKNWMPILGKVGAFVYWCDPTMIVDTSFDGTADDRFVPRPTPACLKDLRGGSQVIPHGGGWLCLTHEVAWRPERVYLHRFVRFDSNFQITHVSDPFFLHTLGIEFCAGLARDGERLVASFGVNDASAHLALFDPVKVEACLRSLPLSKG